MIRSVDPTEHQIQCGLVEATKYIPYGSYVVNDFLIAIPNGGNRSITEAVRLKKEGVKKGVSDLLLTIPQDPLKFSDPKHGLWMECKSKNGKLSDDQRWWLATMDAEWNYGTSVFRSVDEGINAIKNYLGMK